MSRPRGFKTTPTTDAAINRYLAAVQSAADGTRGIKELRSDMVRRFGDFHAAGHVVWFSNDEQGWEPYSRELAVPAIDLGATDELGDELRIIDAEAGEVIDLAAPGGADASAGEIDQVVRHIATVMLEVELRERAGWTVASTREAPE